jgi:hypothetical protein
MEFTVKTELDLSGFKEIEKACKVLSKTVEVGILNNAEEAQIGELQHNGGIGYYAYGAFKGQEVMVPPRPFLANAMNHYGKEILESEATKLSDFNVSTANTILERVGEKSVFATQYVIDEYARDGGNSDRTIITKGKDSPLIDKGNLRASIEYEVVE